MKKTLTTLWAIVSLASYSWSQCNLSVNAGPDLTICEGTNVVLNVSPSGVTYSWSPSSTLSNTTIANPTATPMVTTWYKVKVTDVNGCTATDSIRVNVKPIPVVNAGPDVTYCLPNNSTSFQLSGDVQFTDSISWYRIVDGGGTFSNRMATSAVFTPAANDLSTNFSFVLSGISFAGCSSSDTVDVKRLLKPTVNAGPDQDLKDTSIVYLSGTALNTSAVNWSSGGNGTFIPDNISLNAVYYASVEDLLLGELLFVLNSVYVEGCPAASDTVRVKISTGLSISGTIGANGNATNGQVQLFKLQNQSYELLGSKYYNGAGTYNFSGLSNGNYIVLAQPSSQGFIPTYYGGDTNWTTADLVIIYNKPATEINIAPVAFITADPNAFKGQDIIEGQVTESPENNVRVSGLASIPNATVYLINAQSKILAYTITDLNGNFSFTNLVEGLYALKVDYPGARIEYATADVDGDPNTRTESDLSLEKEVITGVTSQLAFSTLIQLYPNPARDILYVKNEAGNCQLTIYDLNGKMMQQIQLQGNISNIQVDELPNGMYVAEFSNAAKVVKKKFTKI